MHVLEFMHAFFYCLSNQNRIHGEIGSYHDVNQRFLVKPKLNRTSVDII